jgi:hypothetical protein
MERRSFIKTLLGLPLLIPSKDAFIKPEIECNNKTILIQESPVAGFQYYEGKRLWKKLSMKDTLKLIREPDNRFDEKAVEIYWKDRKLGYLPRVENTAVAQMMNQGQEITARIINKQKSWNPWECLTIEVRIQI